MKILLIQPPKAPATIGGEDFYIFEPLGLEYLASAVADSHDIKILDMRLEKGLEKTLSGFRPDIVGITSYTVNVNVSKGLLKAAKDWDPGVFTIIGGHHATVSPEDFNGPFIDMVVMGEGVFSFKEIVRRLEKKEPLDGIPGTAYSKDGSIVKIPSEQAFDLDSLPFPARNFTGSYRNDYYIDWMRPLASIRTSKGCPFRCKFCALWKLTGGKYLTRKPEKIVEELSGINEKYVFFSDDESLIDAKRMTELARMIKDAGIKKHFFLYGRSDTVARHPELLAIWKKIGLERIFIGFEFFRDEDLQYVKKRSNIENNEKAIRILQDLDIEINASFMIRPEFVKKDFSDYRAYCKKVKLNYATYSVLTPLPGTELWDEVKEEMITRNYDFFDFLHTLLPTSLSLEEFYEEMYLLYKKGISFRQWLSFMKRFPLKEILPRIRKQNKILNQIRYAWRDY